MTSLQQRPWQAALAGDVAAVREALDAGAAIDAADAEGATALHLAARGGHADAAAILLVHGARQVLVDALVRKPLAPERIGLETLHAIRQRYHRMRQPRLPLDGIADPESQPVARQIESSGIAVWRGFASGGELQELRAGFRHFVDSLNRRILRHEGSHRGRRRTGGATRDAFFVEFSSDPSDLWGGDLPAHCLDDLDPAAQRLFARFLAAENKWDRPMARRAPAWIENLVDVERWR